MPAVLEAPVQSGLSDAEVAARLQRDGYNELPSARPRSLVAIGVEVVREPMFLLLIASGAVYLLLGDPEEAVALLAAVFLVVGITRYQEQKTERALQALRDLSSPRALVIRDGVTRRVPGREVVRDDLVVLSNQRLKVCKTAARCLSHRDVLEAPSTPEDRRESGRHTTDPPILQVAREARRLLAFRYWCTP